MRDSTRPYVKIPRYTKAEERFNSVTHGIGAIVGLVGLLAMLAKAQNAFSLVCVLLFGLSIVLTYTVSSIYHALPTDTPAKRNVRVLDHCDVHLLVFGSYVPAALLGVGGTFGTALLAFVALFTLIGTAVTFIDVDRFSIPAVICHIVCGWSFIVAIPQLYTTFGFSVVALIVAGGIAYSLGAILYGLGRGHKYMHSIFHIFCLAGTVCHFLAIYLYLL